MIPNWSKMSMNDPLNHLGSIWCHSEPSDVPCPGFFCCFFQQDSSRMIHICVCILSTKQKFASEFFLSRHNFSSQQKHIFQIPIFIFPGKVTETLFREKNETYKKIYRTWLNIVMHFIIPIVCLAIFNFLVLKRFKAQYIFWDKSS